MIQHHVGCNKETAHRILEAGSDGYSFLGDIYIVRASSLNILEIYKAGFLSYMAEVEPEKHILFEANRRLK